MTTYKSLFTLLLFISIFMITGCSNLGNEKQRIDVYISTNKEEPYAMVAQVTDDKQVKKVKDILKDTIWKKRKSEGDTSKPDFQFIFQYKDHKIQAKSVSYAIRKHKEKVELTIDAESRYSQLDKVTADELFKLLTIEDLTEL